LMSGIGASERWV